MTAVSEYLKQRTVHEFQIQRTIEVVPNFVDCDTYGPSRDRSFRMKLPRTNAKPS